MQIQISKVDGQEKYCVEFERKAGSAILFYDNANLILEELSLLNNATLDDEWALSQQRKPIGPFTLTFINLLNKNKSFKSYKYLKIYL